MLEARGVRKTYGGVVALASVDLTVEAGSVHALLGENGAGKSTLVKVLVGAIRPDTGTLHLDGQPVNPQDSADAVASGVAVVSQELSLFPDLDALANLFPMREPRRLGLVDRKAMRAIAVPVLQELGLEVDLDEPIINLPLEQRQLLEIARALCTHPKVLILDEPTSALHDEATQRLHAVLRRLSERGVSIIYVSHHLEDVLDVCDTVTIMRDGLVVAPSVATSTLTVDKIVAHMLGDKAASPMDRPVGAGSGHHDGKADGEDDRDSAGDRADDSPHVDVSAALEFSGVSVPGEIEDVDLVAPQGRIVGLAGVAGAGHRTVLGVAAGTVRAQRGQVTLPDGRALGRGMRQTISQGVAIVSGDRKRFGVMLDKPVWENIGQVQSIGLRRHGNFVSTARLRERAEKHVTRLGIKTPSVDQHVGMLSGGNQQKVVFAKWLESEPSVILLDDPTRGIDVGAKAEIYAVMREQARRGAVQIVFSSDPLELATICDEVVVFHEGRVRGRLRGEQLTAHNILEVMNTGEDLGATRTVR
ncbi:sugar ABC transporter ATP-binding protein [Ornithinimicrobium faecis]|uniref:sugar ABC transporter ATP-binding protein n=1 Tax=Ornithinimicrobium faecis TaxID=2934158 RepID=UPI002118B7B1|nr:sugar ABC transporter ATP-binding protein [Ornithinimicrobium sp. HY1745]